MAWQSFLVILLFLFLQPKCFLSQKSCRWNVVLSTLTHLEDNFQHFISQSEVRGVSHIFQLLTDSAIDPNDRDARYYGFPYYLKINLHCISEDPQTAIRTAHYSGLRPVVTVTFEEPVHSVRQKPELLQIAMTGAPYRFKGGCDSEDVCRMCWFTPMPFVNGSVVMTALVKSNGLGPPMDPKRFFININGYVELVQNTVRFRIGKKLPNLKGVLSLTDPSRPMWFTPNQAPVLILGGFSDMKVVLISDSSFQHFTPIEVGIDSCWIGSISCPQGTFSSSILDTIATESTLFIRQNQLVYYFTGHYSILHQETKGSELWTRILNNVCVKRLNPVFFTKNNTELVIALGGGSQEGEFFLITCKDGVVEASDSLRQGTKTVCDFLNVAQCSILWAVYSTADNVFFLLVNELGTNNHFIMTYSTDEERFQFVYDIPAFVPEAGDNNYVMLLGLEIYTDIPLVPRGLSLNYYSWAFYIWGNVILQSYDMISYTYLSTFPSSSSIKYFIMSFTGNCAFVTDTEEVWVFKETSRDIVKVYPSEAWNMFISLEIMKGSPQYPPNSQHSIVTLFYDKDGFHELAYLEDAAGKGTLMKRPFPVHSLLVYNLMIITPHQKIMHEGQNYIHFTHPCPFFEGGFLRLSNPQKFSRMEHYHAVPPEIMEKTRFHDGKSLLVYQGLVYQLLHLHSSYHRPYADPVHDPTWRWWKNKKDEEEYYNYMASNWKSVSGIYVDMAKYTKIYNLISYNSLPDIIYLDNKTAYSYSVFLSIRTGKDSMGETAEENSLDSLQLTISLADPNYIKVDLQRQELLSRSMVLYQVTIRDLGKFPRGLLSANERLNSWAVLQVARSELHCYEYTGRGPRILGSKGVGIFVGCPPGKRLAFDITYTKNYTTEKNKRYFDCVEVDPEMPCFYFSDVFYPFFLVQDMVTGYSARFNGSYSFTVIGGGAFEVTNIRYFSPEEIRLFNVENENDTGLIWIRDDGERNETDPEGFPVFSEASSGILWVCQQGSACYDIVPRSIMVAPDFYFVIKVTNRGVDLSTYCDYDLEFIVHIHGLRLSSSRAIYFLKISFGFVIGLVVVYIVVRLVAPKVQFLYNKTLEKMKENIAFRAESSVTFTSSFSQGSLQPMSSDLSHISSQAPSQK